MKWSDLTKRQRTLAIGGAAVLALALIGGAFALGRTSNSDARGVGEGTRTAEPTGTAEATTFPGPAGEPEAQASVAPAAPTVTGPPGSEPGPSNPTGGRVFGQLKGIRDESGGGWSSLWVDVDTAVFLSGNAALSWLTETGNADFYNANYWYARNDDSVITSYRFRPDALPLIWMYTWPERPAPGFYGPGMDKQVITFGLFYDRIYMYADEARLLDRYYWFTLEGDRVTIIEEQPRDSYYEP
ncbi:MAG: hypothetical protein U1E08_05040 [Coriobacteriia bacterium]|nr:hypothetical protein [Coriobacteriia bacterium]